MTGVSGLPDQEKRGPLRLPTFFRRRRAAVAMLLLLTSLFAACTGSSDKPSTARANTPQTIQVTVASVQQQDLPIYLNGLGSAEAFYTVNVKSRVDGQLVQVKFREGEFAKKGDLLAVIDPRPYQALLDNAKLNVSYCHITAPESGRIGLRLVDPGNMVHATDANPLLVITQLQPITVIFTLPEDQLQTVAQRMQKGALPVDAYSRDDQTKLASGKLLTIDNQIDQTTGTGRLKA